MVLQRHGLMLQTGTAVDAKLLSAPNSTRKSSGERDSEIHQAKKDYNRYFGMKARIGTDAESSLVHTVIGTADNVNSVTQDHALPHGRKREVLAYIRTTRGQ